MSTDTLDCTASLDPSLPERFADGSAHALFARPMVTSPYAVISIDVDSDNPDAVVVCDGHREARLPAGGRLQVTQCRSPLQWVRLDSAPFTDRLVRKFQLPVTSWRER